MNDCFASKVFASLLSSLRPGVDAIEDLRRQGYCYNFLLEGSKLVCVETKQSYRHLQFEVDEIVYVEHGLNDAEGFSVFALNHRSEELKGIFVAIGFTGCKGNYWTLAS